MDLFTEYRTTKTWSLPQEPMSRRLGQVPQKHIHLQPLHIIKNCKGTFQGGQVAQKLTIVATENYKTLQTSPL